MNSIALFFAVIILAKLFTEWVLNRLNRQHIHRCEGLVPEAFRDVMSQDVYEQSIAYSLDKARLAEIESLIDTALLFLLLYTGFLAGFYSVLTRWIGDGLWAQATVMILMILFLGVLSLPMEW